MLSYHIYRIIFIYVILCRWGESIPRTCWQSELSAMLVIFGSSWAIKTVPRSVPVPQLWHLLGFLHAGAASCPLFASGSGGGHCCSGDGLCCDCACGEDCCGQHCHRICSNHISSRSWRLVSDNLSVLPLHHVYSGQYCLHVASSACCGVGGASPLASVCGLVANRATFERREEMI